MLPIGILKHFNIRPSYPAHYNLDQYFPNLSTATPSHWIYSNRPNSALESTSQLIIKPISKNKCAIRPTLYCN